MRGLRRQVDVSLDVMILVVGGMTVLIAGVLLVIVSTGALGFNAEGLIGLLLVIFALQTITLGRTPFGDARKTPLLLALGMVLAAVGILTCFVPHLLGELPRALLVLCLSGGGLALLTRLLIDEQRCRAWTAAGGVLRRLAWSSGAVYLLSILGGLLVWNPSALPPVVIAFVALVFGGAIVTLAVVLHSVSRAYPEAAQPAEPGLTTDQAMMLLLGVFLVLLGVVLVPVTLGVLPFSGSAQLGLMTVIFATQMVASGSTPLGILPRSWWVIALGLLFEGVGIVSVLVPGILVGFLTVLLGVLNVANGAITLAHASASLPANHAEPRPPPVVRRLTTVQLVMGLLAVLFGSSMLVSQLITGPVLGVTLAAFGCVLLVELWLLIEIDSLPHSAALQPAAPRGAGGEL